MTHLGEVPELEPITSWLVLQGLRDNSGWPTDVAEEWIGVPMPLRYERPLESPEPVEFYPFANPSELKQMSDGVVIYIVDALKSLRIFERHVAAQHLLDLQQQRPEWRKLIFGNNGHGTAPPIFPIDYMERLMPGLQDFDVVQI